MLIFYFRSSEGQSSIGNLIQHMWDQEKEHKKKFDELLPKYRARPTAMLPIWNVAGFVLGAGKCTELSPECLNSPMNHYDAITSQARL